MTRHQPKPKRPGPSIKPPGPAAELRRALARRKKAELVDVLMEMAEADRAVLRRLATRFARAATTDDLVAATHQAIADATAFDNKRDINRNFAYDYEAYPEVARNLDRLIASGQLRLPMPLALELMKRGSYQVEMSDEGLMGEDVEDCLKVVIEAVTKSDLPADEVRAWCSVLLKADRMGFIVRGPLEALHRRAEAAEAQ